MKIQTSWLKEWVDPKLPSQTLCQHLTMAGLEVESVPSSTILDVAITPNRGDCLSVKGLAREIAALTHTALTEAHIPTIKPTIDASLPIHILARESCPHYVGRIIKNINRQATTPAWMQERLTHSGIRCVFPVVDVTNYVMLELGQPMHAFDLAQLGHHIEVRMAKSHEKLILLDNTSVDLDAHTLIIADQNKPLAIAGLMGGIESGINESTQDILLESAFFQPAAIARQRQHYQLASESCFRFERGVDPQLQNIAMERATQLLIEIVGGDVGPIIDIQAQPYQPKAVVFRPERATQILGPLSITEKEMQTILERLGCCCKTHDQWEVQMPSWRFDLEQEIDLIEEVARLFGYAQIPATYPQFPLHASQDSDHLDSYHMKNLLCNLGYHETMTYSFVSADLQALLHPERQAKPLLNPITSDMTTMRTSLWPGLMATYLYNRDRQQNNIRFFETGFCFVVEETTTQQIAMLAGLQSGQAYAEQWGMDARDFDFFDCKGVIENILQLGHGALEEFEFKPFPYPSLHPGQAAFIYKNNERIGVFGALHPELKQKFDILEPIFLFELNLEPILRKNSPVYIECLC